MRDVSKSFNGFKALDDGRRLADGAARPVVWRQVSLLRALAGLETPDSGEILLSRALGPVPAQKRGVASSSAIRGVQAHAHTRQHAFGLQIHSPKAERDPRASTRLLALVHLSRWADRHRAQLSDSQRQGMALARALAVQPGVVALNAGRIEQTGSQDDPYERAANAFAIGFVDRRLAERWVRPHDIELGEDEADGAVWALLERVARVGFEVPSRPCAATAGECRSSGRDSRGDELELSTVSLSGCGWIGCASSRPEARRLSERGISRGRDRCPIFRPDPHRVGTARGLANAFCRIDRPCAAAM